MATVHPALVDAWSRATRDKGYSAVLYRRPTKVTPPVRPG
jgi:hypothetical protein